MARACNLNDDRLWPEYHRFVKDELGKLVSKTLSNFEYFNGGTDNEHFIIWKAGYFAGFERCRDAASDPYPD